MKTLVYQSYRTHGVARFLERSMASVRAWATSRSFDYRFLDDRFFDVLPAWYRERVAENKLVLANLARLLVARDALRDGYDRAIWVDADVVVFAPETFDTDPPDGFAFCRETWIQRRGVDDFVPVYGVNNAVTVFDGGNAFLDYAIWAHERLVRDQPHLVSRFGTSTRLLSALNTVTPLPVLTGVGLLTPWMVQEIARDGDGPTLRELVRRHGYTMQAANVTASLAGEDNLGVTITVDDYDAAVERMIATGGAAFDFARVHAPSPSPSAQSRGTR